MRAVWKYSVSVVADEWQELELPVGAKVLHVACQGSITEVSFWVEVCTTAPKVKRAFRVYGTGHEIESPSAEFVGTTFSARGVLVWHLFERAHG